MLINKVVEIKETLTFLKREEDQVYVVEKKTITPEIPFGDSFAGLVRFCFTRASNDTCRLDISIGVTFLKSTMMRSIIKSNALKGLSESIYPIMARVADEFLSKSAMGNRRGVSAVQAQSPDQIVTEPSISNESKPLSIPTSPVSCECVDHLEKVDIDTTVLAKPKDVFELLFGSESVPFWEEMDKLRGEFDRKEGEWTDDTLPTKEVSYMMRLDNPMLKTKEFEVKTRYTTVRTVKGSLYVIDTKSITPDVPYGDCFSSDTRFCITWIDEKSCRVLISNAVPFQKSTVMKSLIKSNATKGQLEKATQIIGLIKKKLEVTTTDEKTEQTEKPAQVSTEVVKEQIAVAPAALVPKLDNQIISFKTYIMIFISFLIGFMISWELKGVFIKEQHLYRIDWQKELSSVGSTRASPK